MTRQDSDSDLAGKLGAQLTPPVPHVIARHRGEQSSGFFDLAAMQAADLEQIMLRAQASPHLPRAMGLPNSKARSIPGAPLAWPEPEIEWVPESHPRLLNLVVDDAPRYYARVRGVGWFGVAVAWLATMTTGVLIATTVPAHVAARAHVAAPVAAVLAPPGTHATSTSAPPALLATPTSAVTAQGWTVVSAPETPATPPSNAPSVLAGTPHRRPHATPRPAIVQSTDTPPTAQPAAPKTGAAPATPPAAVAEASAPKAAVVPAMPAAPPTAASPPSAGTSLEDLIRREVAAESKRH
jgi:hypothetical protein